MKNCGALLGLACLAALSHPAFASVTYELSGSAFWFPLGFQYDADRFIDAPITVGVTQTDYCGVFIVPCTSLSFSPNTTVNGTVYDALSLNLGGASADFLFDHGDFAKAGTYQSVYGTAAELDAVATLNVSGTPTVPLPASAPLFGAALLSLGVVGAKRLARGKAVEG